MFLICCLFSFYIGAIVECFAVLKFQCVLNFLSCCNQRLTITGCRHALLFSRPHHNTFNERYVNLCYVFIACLVAALILAFNLTTHDRVMYFTVNRYIVIQSYPTNLGSVSYGTVDLYLCYYPRLFRNFAVFNMKIAIKVNLHQWLRFVKINRRMFSPFLNPAKYFRYETFFFKVFLPILKHVTCLYFLKFKIIKLVSLNNHMILDESILILHNCGFTKVLKGSNVRMKPFKSSCHCYFYVEIFLIRNFLTFKSDYFISTISHKSYYGY